MDFLTKNDGWAVVQFLSGAAMVVAGFVVIVKAVGRWLLDDF